MIRRSLLEFTVLLAVAVGLSVGSWQLSPREDEGAKCDPEGLEPGYICFDEAKTLPEVVWVDARPRELWERNGYPDSVLLTDHPSEDFSSLMAEAFEHLISAQTVVVYCATEGCGSSEPVAQKIKELDLLPAEQVFVLHGGWKALPQK